ncbi:hypothetical protein MRX96_038097 [Rhipicephalus microplus]
MDWFTIAGSVLVASLLYLITRSWLSSRSLPPGTRLPPGPPGRPLVGHVQFTHKDFHCNQAMKWAKQYGPVYRIKTGVKCTEVWRRLTADTWVDNRRFCLHVLRDLGFGKTSMEEHVKEECQCIGGEDRRSQSRYPFEHPRRRYLDELLSELFKAIRAGTLVEFLPSFVRKAVTWLPSTRRTVIKSKLLEFIEYTKGQVADHKATMDEHFNRDFIDGYLKKIQEHEQGGEPKLPASISDGQHTVQARVQREIDEVVGRERQPTWEDKNKMPYTMACIWEMYRWKTVSPLGVPRGCGEDTTFDEYFIPKGTTVIPNVWAVHNDPTLWKEPSKFDPTRFFKEDGSLIQPKPEHLIPFSIGKRMCPGEILASVEIFLYITCILQKYRILPEVGKIHDLDSIEIPLVELNHYKLTFTPR